MRPPWSAPRVRPETCTPPLPAFLPSSSCLRRGLPLVTTSGSGSPFALRGSGRAARAQQGWTGQLLDLRRRLRRLGPGWVRRGPYRIPLCRWKAGTMWAGRSAMRATSSCSTSIKLSSCAGDRYRAVGLITGSLKKSKARIDPIKPAGGRAAAAETRRATSFHFTASQRPA